MIKSKKRASIILLLALLFTGQQATAQIQAIIKVGINGSSLRGNTESDFSPIVRFAGGAGISFELRNGFYLQPEVLYIVKGSRIEGRIPISDISPPDSVDAIATSDLTYLEIPILLVYKFRSAKLHPHLFVGPSFSFKMDAQLRTRAAEGGIEFTEEDDSVENRDIGIVFGAGIEFDVGTETVVIDLRSTIGLTNVQKTDIRAKYNTSVGLYAAIVF